MKFSLVYVQFEWSCEKPYFSQPKRHFVWFLLEERAEESWLRLWMDHYFAKGLIFLQEIKGFSNRGNNGVVFKVDPQPLPYLAPNLPYLLINAKLYLQPLSRVANIAEEYFSGHSWRPGSGLSKNIVNPAKSGFNPLEPMLERNVEDIPKRHFLQGLPHH